MEMRKVNPALTALIVAMVMVTGFQSHVWACSNELSRVISSCSAVVSSGSIPGYNSGCCTTLRSVNINCACSQASAVYKGSGSIISPSTAAAVRKSCNLNIPKGLKCAGLNS